MPICLTHQLRLKSLTASAGPIPCHHLEPINQPGKPVWWKRRRLPEEHIQHYHILNCAVLPEMTCINIELTEITSYLATTSEERLPAKQPVCFLTEGLFIGFCNSSAFTLLFRQSSCTWLPVLVSEMRPFAGFGEFICWVQMEVG